MSLRSREHAWSRYVTSSKLDVSPSEGKVIGFRDVMAMCEVAMMPDGAI